jgi:SAM-dependent methyltransferase
MAARGVPVLGIEPNRAMLAQALRDTPADAMPLLRYQAGQAEATGLADGAASLVLAAQAFHWFDANGALREFHRILRPSGWVALLWNERDDTDAFTAAYGAVIRSHPEAAAVERSRGQAGQPLLESPLFCQAERRSFSNQQNLTEDSLLGRAFSASYAPREPDAARQFAASLRAVFARFQQHGQVALHYETSLYLACRR